MQALRLWGFKIQISSQVSIYLQNWTHVSSYVCKAEQTPDFAEVRNPFLITNLQYSPI